MHFYQTFGFSMFSNIYYNTSKKNGPLVLYSRVIIVIPFTLENLCTRTAQSSRGGHSRRVEKWRVYVHLAVEKSNTFLNMFLLRVFFTDYCQ